MLGCTNVNYGTDSVDLCDGGWCYGDHNCASHCCDMSDAPYNQVCTHDGYRCAGDPGHEGLRAWVSWLIALTVLLVVGIFVFCLVRAYIRRKRRREGGLSGSPTSSVNSSRRSSTDSEHKFAQQEQHQNQHPE